MRLQPGVDLPLPLRVQGRVRRLGEMGDPAERRAPRGLLFAVRAEVGEDLRDLVRAGSSSDSGQAECQG